MSTSSVGYLIDTITPDTHDDADVKVVCHRCGDHRRITAYRHVADGVCFACDGLGGGYTTARQVRADHAEDVRRDAARQKRNERAMAKAAARHAAEVAEREAARAAFATEHADLIAGLADLAGDYAADMRERLADDGTLPARHVTRIARILAEKAAEPDPAPVVEGRVTITGKIVSTKWVESSYGYGRGGATKMVVLDDRGFRVYGTRPASLGMDLSRAQSEDNRDAGRGDRVTFTAQVSASRDDETFGFFKRPTRASRVG